MGLLFGVNVLFTRYGSGNLLAGPRIGMILQMNVLNNDENAGRI